jgi:hypothetical protein
MKTQTVFTFIALVAFVTAAPFVSADDAVPQSPASAASVDVAGRGVAPNPATAAAARRAAATETGDKNYETVDCFYQENRNEPDCKKAAPGTR